jgi:hypothetical protein
MQIPNSLVLHMGAHMFHNLMQTRRGASQPFNSIPENPPLISNIIPNIEDLHHSHPLCENLPAEFRLYADVLKHETSARFTVLQILYRYLKAFRYEERQLEAGFGPVEPASLFHDVTTTIMCDMLGYATGEIAYRIQELYVEQIGLYQNLLWTSPQDLMLHSQPIEENRQNPEN